MSKTVYKIKKKRKSTLNSKIRFISSYHDNLYVFAIISGKIEINTTKIIETKDTAHFRLESNCVSEKN